MLGAALLGFTGHHLGCSPCILNVSCDRGQRLALSLSRWPAWRSEGSWPAKHSPSVESCGCRCRWVWEVGVWRGCLAFGLEGGQERGCRGELVTDPSGRV